MDKKTCHGDPLPRVDLRERIRARARELGFARAGFTTAEPLGEAVQTGWRRWREADRAGAMGYLMREHPRRTHPRDLLPEARTAIVLLAPYHNGGHGEPPAPPMPPPTSATTAPGVGLRGKVARYAWGRDYHEILRGRMETLAEFASVAAAEAGIEDPPDHRPCVDSAPLDERALAVRAGLGFTGKNTLLLNPELGSFFLIAVLLTSLELPADPPLREAARAAGVSMPSCGGCRKCLDACPTAAFDDAFRLDPRKCLSYLTIEQREPIPRGLAERMEGWIFGCDICQEVCPYNERPLARVMPELGAEQGVGPWFGAPEIEAVPSGKGFLRAYGHTPLARPGLKGLKRNLEALKKGSAGDFKENVETLKGEKE